MRHPSRQFGKVRCGPRCDDFCDAVTGCERLNKSCPPKLAPPAIPRPRGRTYAPFCSDYVSTPSFPTHAGPRGPAPSFIVPAVHSAFSTWLVRVLPSWRSQVGSGVPQGHAATTLPPEHSRPLPGYRSFRWAFCLPSPLSFRWHSRSCPLPAHLLSFSLGAVFTSHAVM